MSQPCLYRDDVASYVLGALAADEREAFLGHLDDCFACQRDVAELGMTADSLPLTATPDNPPPELKDRIMAVVRSEAELLRAAGPQADRVTPRRRRGWPEAVSPRPIVAVAATLAVLSVGVFGGLELNSNELHGTRVIAARALLQSARAHVEINNRGAQLVMTGMPRPPAGYVYEVWLQRFNQAPRPSGTFYDVDRHGTTVEDVHGDLHAVQRLLVTVEPKPGSAKPTSPPVIDAVLS